VTSPYNSILTLDKLTHYADCVLPMENQALYDITTKIAQAKGGKPGTSITETGGGKKEMPWDAMNQIAAHVLVSLASGMRVPYYYHIWTYKPRFYSLPLGR
jgi:tubulin epsilon